MDKQKLEMDFLDQFGKRFRLGIDQPREDVDEIMIGTAMETVLNENIFQSNEGDLVEIEAARIITTSIMEIEL